MNRLKIIALVLPFLFLSSIPLSLAVAPHPLPWPWQPWKGAEIWLNDPNEIIVSSSDYAYLWHGWTTWPEVLWSELSGEEKAVFMGPGYSFELEIDGTPCQLQYVTWFATYWDTMYRWWWKQWKPGDLTPGEHTFTGRWYANYACVWEVTRTVTVT